MIDKPMPTISKLYDCHAEATKAATDLVAAGVSRVNITVIGPYSDEIGKFRLVAGLCALGACAGLLAYFGTVLAPGVDLIAANAAAKLLASASCGGAVLSLLGALASACAKRDGSGTDGIILLTADFREDDNDAGCVVRETAGRFRPIVAEAA